MLWEYNVEARFGAMVVRSLEEFTAPPPDTKIWRYIDLTKFSSLVKESALYFASARELEDKFEGAITRPTFERRRAYAPDIHQRVAQAFEELRRLTKINCWHMSSYESAAMWRLYCRDGKGVALQSTVGRFVAALRPYRIQPNFADEDVWIGAVRYIDYRNTAGEPSMLGRFFQKRRSFEYESEFRAVISLRTAEEFGVRVPKKGIFVSVDAPTLCETIYLAPGSHNALKRDVTAELAAADLLIEVNQSELDDPALY